MAITKLDAHCYVIPTEQPESDGTLTWSATSWVVVELFSEGQRGLGWTYCHPAAERVISQLAELVVGHDPLDIPGLHRLLVSNVRNVGLSGVAACAISAIDVAVWDLKARLLEVPLAKLFGRARARVPVYGSGGFTSYSTNDLVEHMRSYPEQGIRRVKMKVGREPDHDRKRVALVREALGDQVDIYVDANGAYDRKGALEFADRFQELHVVWFEEPVSSDDLLGLRLLRDRAPSGMQITAGEYGYESGYFRRMLEAGAVDVLMVDATRCLGYSGMLEAAALAGAFRIPLSTHCAPYLHLPIACALPNLLHAEYFFDHARIERRFLDGTRPPRVGELEPDLATAGHGYSLRRADAASHLAS